MKQKLKYIAALLLIIEGLYPVYTVFFTYFLYKHYFILVYSVAFFALAYFTTTHFHKRWVQWLAIIFSLLIGIGGFIGLGWIFAITLAVIFIVGGKNTTHAI